MALAIFDLDNTLLQGDSDYLWGVFLGDEGIVDADYYARENERFYREYRDGQLDIMEFLRFSLQPLSQHEPQQLYSWREKFIASRIQPIISQQSYDLVNRHRSQNDTLMIITATNAFVTEPIAELLGIEHLIATRPEMRDGRYTGRVDGIPSFQQGKVERLQQWLEAHDASLQDSYFYSDSHNDLPLLQRVDHPVAVDPDDKLRHYAETHDWPVISLQATV